MRAVLEYATYPRTAPSVRIPTFGFDPSPRYPPLIAYVRSESDGHPDSMFGFEAVMPDDDSMELCWRDEPMRVYLPGEDRPVQLAVTHPAHQVRLSLEERAPVSMAVVIEVPDQSTDVLHQDPSTQEVD